MTEHTRWEHIRGVLILLHIIAVILMALPAPQGAMRKNSWKEPTVQGEIQAWSERLNRMGYQNTPEELETRLWEVATDFTETRKKVLAPIQPYAKYLGTQQSWRMFVAPHRYPTRLHIEIKESGEDWQTISIYQDPDHDWKADLFEHDRFRSALFRYGWKSYGGARQLFNEWLAREAAAEFPEATHLRTRWYKNKTPTPEMVKADEEFDGEFVLSKTLVLSKFRESP